MGKKVIAAGIKQLLEFDCEREMYCYIGNLRARKIQQRICDHMKMEDGKIRLIIIKAYNSSTLIQE